MGSLFQTSGFRIQASEAQKLLRVFPLQIEVGESPSLYFRIDGDVRVGTPVSYRLVCGFWNVKWKCVIASVEGSSWNAELSQGPFTSFKARHEESPVGNSVEFSDEIDFTGESSDLSEALEQASFKYALSSRAALLRAKDSFESRRKTESFRAYSSENLSAG